MRDEFDNVGAEFHSTKPRFLTDKDVFYICVILGLLAYLWISPAHAQVRFELGIGKCDHSLAQDGSWSYRDWGSYQNHNDVHPGCAQAGAIWMPAHRWGLDFGLRGAVVDLGAVKATGNTYPINEAAYFQARTARTAVVDGGQGTLSGEGSSWGFTIGPVMEKRFGNFNLGGELGLAYIKSTWHVSMSDPLLIDWHNADGWRWTNYVGAQARYKLAYVSVRRYADVGAWSSEPGRWGLTLGPVIQASVGLSVPL